MSYTLINNCKRIVYSYLYICISYNITTNVKKRKHKAKPPSKNLNSSKQILYEFRRVLQHYFPNLLQDIEECLVDTRRKKSCTYRLSEIIMGAIMIYITGSASRNSLNENRDWSEFRSNYKSLLGLKVSHMDTVNAVLEKLPADQLSKLLYHLVKILFDKRVFHKFRLLDKYFTIAIDGTGIFKFKKKPYPGCPYKTSKKGKVT